MAVRAFTVTPMQPGARISPVHLTRPAPAGLPASWLNRWTHPVSALMESGRSGRTTVLIPEFPEVWLCRETFAERVCFAGGAETSRERVPGGPKETLERLLSEHGVRRDPAGPEFQGGLFALLSYELAGCIEKIPTAPRDDLGAPLAIFAPVPGALVHDRVRGEISAVAPAVGGDREGALARCEALLANWFSDPPAPDFPPPSVPVGAAATRSFDEAAFTAGVSRIRDYIRAGDTYQVNLSTRQTVRLPAAPEKVYETLRRLNPSPYMGLFRMPGFTLVCGSPELLARVRDGRIESRPIAGTRPRGETPESDASLEAELTANAKENAEHLMLVDLLRNDLGRVSKPGSVHVSEYMTVERYSHVMHLVSHVVGEPAPEASAWDVVASVFPGGTITGAPKVRTMEIIAELEPVRRAFYTGSAGWIAGADEMHLNIIIRTLHAQDGLAHVQAGAGVVADSEPAREYRESLNKARAALLALERTEA